MTPIFKIAKLLYNIINIYISVVVFKIIPELAKYWRHFFIHFSMGHVFFMVGYF